MGKTLNTQIVNTKQACSVSCVVTVPDTRLSFSLSDVKSQLVSPLPDPKPLCGLECQPPENKGLTCQNPDFIVLNCSDGITRRKRCTCDRTTDCTVCLQKRSKRIYKRFNRASDSMHKPKFLTLTFDSDVLPQFADIVQCLKIIRDGNAWKNLRKNYLRLKTPKWFRVYEFGPKTRRIHIHLVVDDPDDYFPEVHLKKHWSKSQIMKVIRSNPKASQFYDLINSWGFGYFSCETARSQNSVAGYLLKYLNKPLPKFFKSPILKNFRTYDVSRSCPGIDTLDRRFQYKLFGIMRQESTGNFSEILEPGYSGIPDSDFEDTLQQDYEFQMDGCEYTEQFKQDVDWMLHYRYAVNLVRSRIQDRNFFMFWNTIKSKFLTPDVLLHMIFRFYCPDISPTVPYTSGLFRYHDFLDPNIVQFVYYYCQYHRALQLLRSTHNCTATIRFLDCVIAV